jgi:DNA-binding transcriptional LysR family regulator
MANLNSLMIFAKVVEAGSFSQAAVKLAMPLSTVSRKVAELEDQLGVRLLERSTRKLRLTDVGSEILEQAWRTVDVSESIDSIASNRIAEVKGTLRLSAPPSISESLLAPLVGAFQASYPEVRVSIMVTDRHVDHIAEGIDLVFRVGELKDSSLIARPILRYRHLLVASPEYLASAKSPKIPADLLDHRLFAFSFWSQENSWTFVKGDREESVFFQPFLSMNDYAGLAAALIAGGGIGDMPPIVSPRFLKEKSLVEVMPEWRFKTFDLSIVHLGNRHVSRAVRVFKEFTAQMTPTLFNDLPT